MAEIKSEIATMRLMVDHLIQTYNENRMDQQTASMCKLLVTEKQVELITKVSTYRLSYSPSSTIT